MTPLSVITFHPNDPRQTLMLLLLVVPLQSHPQALSDNPNHQLNHQHWNPDYDHPTLNLNRPPIDLAYPPSFYQTVIYQKVIKNQQKWIFQARRKRRMFQTCTSMCKRILSRRKRSMGVRREWRWWREKWRRRKAENIKRRRKRSTSTKIKVPKISFNV